MKQFLLIGLGGAVGTWARYLMSVFTLRTFGAAFPYGTLTVNVLGSFLIAIVMHVGLSTELISPTTRIILATGVMGGFTTYSSFSYETLQYIQDGEPLKGAANIAIMVCSCLAASWMGVVLAKRVLEMNASVPIN